MHINLGGRQADPLGVVHGGNHVSTQGSDTRVNRGHRLGQGVQTGVGEAENGK